jgi:hypothetical protein
MGRDPRPPAPGDAHAQTDHRERAASPADGTRPRVPTAVISDIHGNAVALRAVLEDIEPRASTASSASATSSATGPSRSPASISSARSAPGRSWATTTSASSTSPPTSTPPPSPPPTGPAPSSTPSPTTNSATPKGTTSSGRLRVRVVEHMPSADGSQRCRRRPVLCVHASPRRPINEYIFPDDAKDAPDKMHAIFERVETHRDGRAHPRPGRLHRRPRLLPPLASWARNRSTPSARREDRHQRRLGWPAARPRPAGRVRRGPPRPRRFPPRPVRHRGHRRTHQGHPRPARLAGRPPLDGR